MRLVLGPKTIYLLAAIRHCGKKVSTTELLHAVGEAVGADMRKRAHDAPGGGFWNRMETLRKHGLIMRHQSVGMGGGGKKYAWSITRRGIKLLREHVDALANLGACRRAPWMSAA